MSQSVQRLRGVGAVAEQDELINANIAARFFSLHFALITGICSEVQVTVSFLHIILIVSKLLKYFFLKFDSFHF